MLADEIVAGVIDGWPVTGSRGVSAALAASLFGHTDGGRRAGPIVPLLQLHLGSAVTQVTSI